MPKRSKPWGRLPVEQIRQAPQPVREQDLLALMGTDCMVIRPLAPNTQRKLREEADRWIKRRIDTREIGRVVASELVLLPPLSLTRIDDERAEELRTGLAEVLPESARRPVRYPMALRQFRSPGGRGLISFWLKTGNRSEIQHVIDTARTFMIQQGAAFRPRHPMELGAVPLSTVTAFPQQSTGGTLEIKAGPVELLYRDPVSAELARMPVYPPKVS